MPLREDLLNPISETSPGGQDIRYEPVYDQIKEARRQELDLPTGGWETERKTADYALVTKLASEALATRSKDLQVAAWLTEAQLRREGFAGLRDGLDLIREMVEQFWDNLYPEIEDGDAEFRAAPLDWIGSRLGESVREVPLNRTGHSYLAYMESRGVSYEEQADTDEKQEARSAALAAGKLSPEEFDSAFDATPKDWYKQLVADLDSTLASVDALDQVGQERFDDVAPGYTPLRASLEEVRRVARQLLAKKLELEPDPVDLHAPLDGEAGEGAAEAVGADSPGGASAAAASATGGTLSAEPASVADAAARTVGAAHFLRRAAPTSPVPYLLLRALRWGELRAGGEPLDPKLLEAPSSQARAQLKTLLLDGKWSQLLEAAERVMGTPAGRGWLDLQRHVVTACDALGDEYRPVRAAVLSEVRGLLADIPVLPDLTMMDDLPTASPETRAWLVDQVVAKRDAVAEEEDGGAEWPVFPLESVATNGNGRDRIWDRAKAEIRGGRPQKAIEILSGELERETSQRGRFLRRAQLAQVLVETGFDAVASPILQQMLETIDTLKLDDWEAGPVVAQPLALLYRCIAKADGDTDTLESLYLRLCRLDPVQAIGVTRQ